MQIKNKGIVGVTFGLAVGLAIGVVVSLQAGPLTPPPTAVSGGVPVSTMKTLEQVTPTWDRTLPANDTGDPCNSSRFTCVMGNVAVRDNETGLVWQRAPVFNSTWQNAMHACLQEVTGNRGGWRLPTIQELLSVLAGSFSPAIPFTNLSPGGYWSSTTQLGSSTFAWRLSILSTGAIAAATNSKDVDNRYWCVRGGNGLDSQ